MEFSHGDTPVEVGVSNRELSPVEALRRAVDDWIYPELLASSDDLVRRSLSIPGEQIDERTSVDITRIVPLGSRLLKLLRLPAKPELEISFRWLRPNTSLVVNERFNVSSKDEVRFTAWNDIDDKSDVPAPRQVYCEDIECPPDYILDAVKRLRQARYGSEQLQAQPEPPNESRDQFSLSTTFSPKTPEKLPTS